MENDLKKLEHFREEVSNFLGNKVTLVLNPDKRYFYLDEADTSTVYDADKWEILDDEIITLVNDLAKATELSDEKKILSIYKKICQVYEYDDNLVSYVHPIDRQERIYSSPEEYGRTVNQEWKSNRSEHNRRVCYELSRILVAALIKLFSDNKDFNACIFWDKERCHYFCRFNMQ